MTSHHNSVNQPKRHFVDLWFQYVIFCGYIARPNVELAKLALQNNTKASFQRRRDAILQILREHSIAEVAQLATALSVSTETIRRDLRQLVAGRQVVKRHGSVALPSPATEAPFLRRMGENAGGKRAIARRAARLVEDGDSLMIDTGTTTTLFARELLGKHDLTVLTNSSDIARALSSVASNTVYLAGGEMNGETGAMFGPSAVEFMASFRARHVFLSVAGLDPDFGISDAHLAEAELARMMLSRAEQRTVLCDASKLGRASLIKICDLGEINRLVCDAMPGEQLAIALAAAKVRVNVVAP